ncbi:hypothetical protein NBRGN_066_00640 [Nocardia brasiliensis NBRC 14402]|uniref:matrixin family metalloprotease n=1 Tax=Nocardia brasiliensis TaxID=37326 RepID=UPI00045D34EC|nr:matrixin family metalloprotease [Nocardia brasiliensis]GAJ83839.1 hypothetical protein NBRGN_066_00640 [Nocardia brasiliensis NBRC 14402]SUB54128.1 Uncharacterised protein [Nocardia brasiliensis]
MSNAAHRVTYRGRHRVPKSPTRGTPQIFATVLAGALLAPVALSLTTTTATVAQAARLGFKAPIQGYDKDGRAIIHYNNKIHDPNIENAVEHLNSTPGLNIVFKPGTGRGAIDISRGQLGQGVAGLGGMDAGGPFVKISSDINNMNSGDRTEVAGHELLHSIGLDHDDSGCSIMASVVNRCKDGATPLQKKEINELNSMYKRGKPGDSSDQDTGDYSSDQQGEGSDRPGDTTAGDDRFGDDSADPFGDLTGSDPFADFPGSDPFGDPSGSDTGGDPFGDIFDGDTGSDPFGDFMDADTGGDPFGDLFGGDTGGDPFGDLFSGGGDGFDWFTGADDPFGGGRDIFSSGGFGDLAGVGGGFDEGGWF